MTKHKKSSQQKWLMEAKNVVIEKGVEAINIDALSKKIGVAKTSFYHFYNSKAQFLDLLFISGIQDGTEEVIKKINAIDSSKSKVEKLIEIVIGENLNNELFLRRLRTFGLHNKMIHNLINETEVRRMEFLKTLLVESGIEESQASEKAHYFYLYILGLYERIYANPEILKDKQKIYDRLNKLLESIGNK